MTTRLIGLPSHRSGKTYAQAWQELQQKLKGYPHRVMIPKHNTQVRAPDFVAKGAFIRVPFYEEVYWGFELEEDLAKLKQAEGVKE